MIDNTLLVQCLFNKIEPIGKLTPLQTVLIKLDKESFEVNYAEMKKMMIRIFMTPENQSMIKRKVEKEWKKICKAKRIAGV